MAITSGYFNSVNGDRKYNADQMSEYFEGIINEGVCQHIDGGLAVTAGTGLSVNVAAGKAFIGKKWIRNDASLTLTISAASASYARIDAVVLRRNNTTRTCQIVVKSGTPAASPAAPSLTRNSTTYEMALAYVNVSAGATSVTVTDKRSDTTVCGWATVAQQTSGEVDAMLNAMKTGFDGVVYSSPAAMVQGCDTKLQTNIDTVKQSALNIGDKQTVVYLDNAEMTASAVTSNTNSRLALFDISEIHGARAYIVANNNNRFRIAYTTKAVAEVAVGTTISEFQSYDGVSEKIIDINDYYGYKTLIVYVQHLGAAIVATADMSVYNVQDNVILKKAEITDELSYTEGYIEKDSLTVVSSSNYHITEPIILPPGATVSAYLYGNQIVSVLTKTDKNGVFLSCLEAGVGSVSFVTYKNTSSNTEYVVANFSINRDHFIYVSYPELYGALASFKKSNNTDHKIVVYKITDEKFAVRSYMDEGGYLTHTFKKVHAESTIGGVNYVTTDVWYAEFIQDKDGNNLMQGNTNFIHNIIDHSGYVGAGDGCCVAIWSLFFVDGKEFDPTTMTAPLYGNEFRFTEKVKHYLSDGTHTTSTIPVIVDGSPVIESFNFIDYVLKGNNEIEHRNKLVINMDNIQFDECHGAMVACYPPYFTNVIINNKEMSWNAVDLDDNFAIIKKGGTNLNLKTNGFVRANEVIMFGDKYRVTNQLFQMDGDRNKITNIRPWFPPNTDNRIKLYMMPVVCSISAENIAAGESVETFNTGDEINVLVKRKIDVSE